MSATFKTTYGGSASFTFYSFRQIAELCRNKAVWEDITVDLRDYFKKYLEVEKVWFERSKNPAHKKIIYAIERIFLSLEKYDSTTIPNVDKRFEQFVRNVCAVRTPRSSSPVIKGCVKFRKSILHEVEIENSEEIGLRKEYADAFTEESRRYGALWRAEDSVRNSRHNLRRHKDTVAVYAAEDTRRETGLTELKNLEQYLQKAEDRSAKAYRAWIAQCRKIMKLAEGTEK